VGAIAKFPDDKALFAISVAAELCRCHPRTLRLYEEYGFITPVRTEGNTRLYSPRDIAIVERIRYYTQVKGVNLAGVKVILEMERRRSSGDGEKEEG